MLDIFSDTGAAIPVTCLTPDGLSAWLDSADTAQAGFTRAQGFMAKAGQAVTLVSADGEVERVLFGLGNEADAFVHGGLAGKLQPGLYRFDPAPEDHARALLGFALGTYHFDRYKSKSGAAGGEPKVRMLVPNGIDCQEVSRLARGIFLARDLINTPASDMGPAELEAEAEKLQRRFDARLTVTRGDDLIRNNYPMIHAVGRASDRAPRLIDLTWGRADAPKVTLVGKGVCFDTGGLNLKPGNYMALMKKDMGGAATAMALAQMIMDKGLDVRLRLLVAAVENSVSGNAFRPGDVLPSRKGLTVEISNTDAEGRLVLGDALAEADDESPDLLVDFATLTGAARVALGPDLPPFFTKDDALADALEQAADAAHDPLWRLPLWPGYEAMLDSKVADINHAPESPFAGSVTAALFLNRFVTQTSSYIHFDVYGWMPKPKPGRPVGGELQAARAVYHLLCTRYG
jgi:leucyl aminopeptidase